MMHQLYVLFEHAAGFAIFRTTEFEEIAAFLPQVRQSITNISKFRSIVFLVSFQPFQSPKEALENMKCLSRDILSTDLQLFLENNIPRSKKSKQGIVLGVQEPGLASEINEKLGIVCKTSGVVKEIIRGIRFHFYKLVKGFKDPESGAKSQLALAHHFSREKVNFDARRQDCMIIEGNSLVDELEKDINVLTRRIKEWYSLHFPELFAIVDGDAETVIKCVKAVGDRKNMPDDIIDKLNVLLENPSKVEKILEASQRSMGMEVAPVDLENMNMFCDRVLSLIHRQKTSLEYLKSKMNFAAPTVSALVGEMVGSRLISRAGGLTNLAKLPASTVQVLGADKKLFRSVKGKNKAPACGFISTTSFAGKSGKTRKGHLARILSNKCSLAARVDCFSKKPQTSFGPKLIEDVERIIKLHKRFKANIEKEIKEQSKSTKKGKNKKSKQLSKTDNKLLSNVDTESIEAIPMEDTLKLSHMSIDSSEGEKVSVDEVPKVDEKELSPSENISDLETIKAPVKKMRKSQHVLPIPKNSDDEASKIEESDPKGMTPKRSKRISKCRSIRT